VDAFLWPQVLLLLLAAPLLVWWYRRGRRPPARAVSYHPDLALLARAVPAGRGRARRHLPAALYLAALLLAVVALARPTLPVPEAHPQAGIVLALDVSISMQATDVSPSRIAAAVVALEGFVRELPPGTRVGLVTFAGYATLAVPLTDDHDRVLQAVRTPQLGRGTVIGDALLASVGAFAPLEERRASGEDPRSLATVVLLSDGANRGGTPPLVALDEVIAQQVTVHTIGVGSAASGGGDGFGAFGGAMRFDETTLRTIAERSGGRFAFVDSAEELGDVYRDLSRAVAWRVRRDEATAVAALAAAVLLATSMGLAGLLRRV
jgi:Ca-activated chloride channel homolog